MVSILVAMSEQVNLPSIDSASRSGYDPGMASTVADRVRQVLALRRWSQRELSRRAGLSEGAVGWMLAHPDRPTETSTLEGIATASRVSLAWLATGQGSPEGDDERPLSTTDDSTPIMKNVPGWAEVLEADRADHPGLEDVYWERATASAPFMVYGPAQPGDAAKLAKMAKALGSPERMTELIRQREERIKVLEEQLAQQLAEQRRIEAGGGPKKRTRGSK